MQLTKHHIPITPKLFTKSREINMKLERNELWLTTVRGSNNSEYNLYLDLMDDGTGREAGENYAGCAKPYVKGTGPLLKTFDEWVNS